jgi:hypothetical protein
MPNPYHDAEGKFATKDESALGVMPVDFGPRTPGGVRLEGAWSSNPGRAEAVSKEIDGLLAEFPVPFRALKLREAEEFGQLGGKSADSIYLSPRFMDDQFMAGWLKEWRGINVQERPEHVVTHEFGHVLDGHLNREHSAAYREHVWNWVNEPVSYEVGGRTVTAPRWQAGVAPEVISAYGSESPFEYIAEGFADYRIHGANAHPRSLELVARMKQALAT